VSGFSWTFFRSPALENVRASCRVKTANSDEPLVGALNALSRGEDPLSARVVPQLARRVATGATLSASLQGFPQLFPAAYVWLVRGGEETGALHQVMLHLADWLERQDKLGRQVRKALTYPGLVVILVAVLTLGLFRTVIPRILEAAVGVGADLPGPTRALLLLVDLVQSPWFWLLVVLLVAVLTGYLRSPRGSRLLIQAMLQLPVLGDLLLALGTARLSLTLALLMESGTEVMRACALAGSATGLAPMVEDAERVRAELRHGHELSQVYGASPLYPPPLADMLKAGEESGRMVDMLRHTARLFEDDTFDRLQALTNALEPIILGVISLGVGFILLAIMLPMNGMLSNL
jgi:type IV pilus assembly protein PilC